MPKISVARQNNGCPTRQRALDTGVVPRIMEKRPKTKCLPARHIPCFIALHQRGKLRTQKLRLEIISFVQTNARFDRPPDGPVPGRMRLRHDQAAPENDRFSRAASSSRHGPACQGHLSPHVPKQAARTSRAMTEQRQRSDSLIPGRRLSPSAGRYRRFPEGSA